MCRQTGVKPSLPDIGRRYGLDRHTVARHWGEGPSPHDGRGGRVSALDEVRDVMLEKAALPGITKRAIHEYLPDRRADLGLPGHSAFTEYRRRTGIEAGASAREAHPRFETAPGASCSSTGGGLSMHDRRGRRWGFDVFTATLSWSRPHVLAHSTSKAADALPGCLVEAPELIGGVPEECLTDNTSAPAAVSGGRRRKSERAWRSAREAGSGLALCRPRSPGAKGEDESANRLVGRPPAYEGDLEGEPELVSLIARPQARCDAECV